MANFNPMDFLKNIKVTLKSQHMRGKGGALIIILTFGLFTTFAVIFSTRPILWLIIVIGMTFILAFCALVFLQIQATRKK